MSEPIDYAGVWDDEVDAIIEEIWGSAGRSGRRIMIPSRWASTTWPWSGNLEGA
jgi:hypothetical protein